jgi:hypothetical protein
MVPSRMPADELADQIKALNADVLDHVARTIAIELVTTRIRRRPPRSGDGLAFPP